MYEGALSMLEATVGPDHPDVGVVLNNLAYASDHRGDLPRARDLYQRALAIKERVYGVDHLETAVSLSNLAGVLHDLGDSERGDGLLRRSLEIRERALGPDHPDVALALNNLAHRRAVAGDLAGARPLARRGLTAATAALGPDHGLVQTLRRNLSIMARDAGDTAEARELSAAFVATVQRTVRTRLPGLAGDDRLRLLEDVREAVDLWMGVRQAEGESGWGEVLRLKGLLGTLEARRRAEARAGSAGWKELRGRHHAAQRTLARLAAAVPPTRRAEARAAWQERYASAAKEEERLSVELERAVGAEATGPEADVTPSAVRGALPADAVLVDLLRTRGRYWAFVAARDRPEVRLDLGDAEEVDRLVEEVRADLGAPSPAAALAALLLRPLVPHVPVGTARLVLCPDGALATLPFAVLPWGETRAPLLEAFPLHHLASPSDLLVARQGGAGRGALVVGGVEYGTPAVRDERRRSGLRPLDLAPLPGAAAEAAEVAARLGSGALLLRGRDATEERVRSEVVGRGRVHLATHGFVREVLGQALRRATRWTPDTLDPAAARHLSGFDPMVLPGLALAGAATGDGGGDDDGVLTALEATQLDLSAADVVVLSGCATAGGTNESGEGMLGLVRGFRLAGARSVVASLWDVDDDSTRLLMRRFYDLLLDPERPVPPAEAIRQAASWLRSVRSADGAFPYASPSHWAAFVAFGPP
jgi:CHAT domain-containing protein